MKKIRKYNFIMINYGNGTGSNFPLPLSDCAKKLLLKRIESNTIEKILIKKY